MFNNRKVRELEDKVDFLANKVRELALMNSQLISIMETQGTSISNIISICNTLGNRVFPVSITQERAQATNTEYPNTPNGV